MNGKFYHVQNCNKRYLEATREQDEQSWETLKSEFLKAVANAAVDLDGAPPLKDSSSSSQPLAEPQPESHGCQDSAEAIENGSGGSESHESAD